MSGIINRYERDNRALKVRFWISAVLLLLAAVACVSQSRTRRLHEKTYAELVKAKTGLDKLKEANLNRRKALATLKAQFGSSTLGNSSERIIYAKLDEIKDRLRQGDLSVTTIERKGGEVVLPYTLKFKDHNYSEFLNAISYLQQSNFPLTPVSSVDISQADETGKGVVLFTVSGKILTTEMNKP